MQGEWCGEMVMVVTGRGVVNVHPVCYLQSDILGINEIFRDLSTMVHEQGETIGTLSDIRSGRVLGCL